jgi:Ser/Thr protein kinase RdoA (MazF antagonist)
MSGEIELEAARRVLTEAWALPAPERMSPLAHGTNNLMWRVDGAAGSHVLRVYRNHDDLDRLRFEHTVLARVQALGLPFAVPAPLPTVTGEFSTRLATVHGEALATLTPLIPGEHPNRDDLAQAESAGEALALLDVALAGITPDDPHDGLTWRSTGDLTHCHPLVPDPVEALRSLPLPAEACQRLIVGYERLMAAIPAIYGRLPQQLVHEDFDPLNILVEGTRVAGVLDFEFCSRDVRVMDLTVTLQWWPVAHFGTGREWPILRAVAQGYTRHLNLSGEEVEALPVLLRFRGYTSLIHRLGRYRMGLSPQWAVVDRAEFALAREEWLATHGSRLVETIASVGEECDR